MGMSNSDNEDRIRKEDEQRKWLKRRPHIRNPHTDGPPPSEDDIASEDEQIRKWLQERPDDEGDHGP